MLKKSIFILVTSLFLQASVYADIKTFAYQRRLKEREIQESLIPPASTTLEGVYSQKIDHFNVTDQRVFDQRYFINSDYAKLQGKLPAPDAPVLFMICGEATCNSSDLDGAIAEHAQKLGAHRIALEHRYYGKSQPFAQLTSKNLQFLSTPQAIEDLADFQDYATKKLGLTGPWIAVGGSYSGNLSAYYRLKHPNKVVGALASSAPVRAEANFESYDKMVTLGAGPQCAKAMQEVVAKVEASLNNPTELLKMKKLFEASDVDDPVDFLYTIADMGAIAIQYGYRDEFCDQILKGDALDGYAVAGKRMFQLFGITAFQDSFQFALDENPSTYLNTFGARQWLYQTCTEYGYWQNAHHDPAYSTRSSLINPEYHNHACERLFGIQTPVNTDKINKNFYEPLIHARSGPKNIIFTNGSTDPWSELSIATKNGNASNPFLSLFLIDGAAHCDDLRRPSTGDSPQLLSARNLFFSEAKKWLSLP